MRRIDRDTNVKALAVTSCPTNPPPYKRGVSSGGKVMIGNCLTNDCCNCCNAPPPACPQPQAGFVPFNCCDVGLRFTGKIYAQITGTNCGFDGTWYLNIGTSPSFGYYNNGLGAGGTSCKYNGFFSLNAACVSTFRQFGNPPTPIPAMSFIFGLGLTNMNLAGQLICSTSGSSTNFNTPVLLTGTCYPLNLKGNFFLYQYGGPGNTTRGCNYCQQCNDGQVTITTEQGGY